MKKKRSPKNRLSGFWWDAEAKTIDAAARQYGVGTIPFIGGKTNWGRWRWLKYGNSGTCSKKMAGSRKS